MPVVDVGGAGKVGISGGCVTWPQASSTYKNNNTMNKFKYTRNK